MPGTERTLPVLRALLADNGGGDIDPVDIRDVVASCLGGYAGLILTTAAAPVPQAINVADAVITAYDVVTAESIDEFVNGCNADEVAGTITVGTTGFYEFHYFMSATLSNNNRELTFTPYVDNVAASIEVSRFFTTGSDIGHMSMSGIVLLTAGQVLDMRVNTTTGATTISYDSMSFHIKRVG